MKTIVRRSDNVAAHDGAHKALTARSHHKRVALAVLYSTVQALSAQDVRERALSMKLVATISAAESVRRRVLELMGDGYLMVQDERGPSGATFVFTPKGLKAARVAADELSRQG
jgi:hypothetical protein